MSKHLKTIFGWYGAIALITGYILISFGVIDARSLPYQLLVLTGCLGIVIEALQKKDLVAAAKYYEEYLATDKTDENVYVNYGICLANINRLDEAINALNNAIRIDPSKPDVYQILAQVYQAKGDMQAAQQAMISAQSIILAEQERNPQEDN